MFCIAEHDHPGARAGAGDRPGASRPVFAPFRILAIVYADFFRGSPDDPRHRSCSGSACRRSRPLVAARLDAAAGRSSRSSSSTRPTSRRCTGPGIEFVHPSQDARRPLARAVAPPGPSAFVDRPRRRCAGWIPPLLNDFIGLQKDTALVSVIGAIDALQQATIDEAESTSTSHPFICRRRSLRRDHDSAHPLHRPPRRPRPGAAAGFRARSLDCRSPSVFCSASRARCAGRPPVPPVCPPPLVIVRTPDHRPRAVPAMSVAAAKTSGQTGGGCM